MLDGIYNEYKKMGKFSPPSHKFGSEATDGKEKISSIVRSFLKTYPTLTDPGGTLYTYNGIYWEAKTTSFYDAILAKTDRDNYTTARSREFLSYLRATTYNDKVDTWQQIGELEIPFRNGVLDITTCELRPHRVNDFLENVIPHTWDGLAECPNWEKCLDDWFGDELEKRKCLQLFAGYVLLPHHKYKTCLYLYGDTDCGKSVIISILRALVGEEFCGNLPVHKMDDVAARSQLMGKKLNTVTELRYGITLSEDAFKTMVGTGEPLTCRRLYSDPVSYVFRAKHAFAANEFPIIQDNTRATINRFCILQMFRSIPKAKQDPDLQLKLLGEMSGILCWAVQGARELTQLGGKFPIIPGYNKLVDELMTGNNIAKQFIDECLTYTGNEFDYVTINSMQEKFLRFSNGRNLSRIDFLRMIKRASTVEKPYIVKDKTVGDENGERRTQKCLLGFAFPRSYGPD